MEYEVFEPPLDEYYEQSCAAAYAAMFAGIPLSQQKGDDHNV